MAGFRFERLQLLLFATWGLLLHSAFASTDDSSSSSSAATEKMYSYRLPRVHLQFICHQDIRSQFSVVDTFDAYYREILPKLSNTTLRHELQSNSMKDIPVQKWYFNSCNISSPQVLLTMETEGWAQYYLDWNGTASSKPYEEDEFNTLIMEQATPASVEEYIKGNVCKDMDIYRAYVEDWSNQTSESFEHEEYVEHSLILLCGGEDYIYYEEEDPGSGFVLLGMMVGIVMFSMIFTELQQFNQRTSTRRPDTTTNSTSSNSARRSSRRRDQQRVDYALTPSEVEMV
jgi:hypothetical protein